ncbi:hydroxyisourate hydrolase [Sphingomonas canadensis]|uniref:5-hydroxyisourate hydrolase n=1 Tax=Sphingomonas canadensis TaxID=1219257 RepID=A0ABW3HAL0_9SPHN|nr:hydroxyisourate hydrolase [Sphingomonas canadensis]MCW3837405.1 hydroxyisourate hydrolase [Sphingomonas canadensis]
MTSLSTHVLDTAHGRPAAGMGVRLWRDGRLLFAGETNADGRCPALTEGADYAPGGYRIEFDVAAYFRAQGVALPDPPFLDVVAIAFGMAEADGHYHVPLLVTPFGYSTYRGS